MAVFQTKNKETGEWEPIPYFNDVPNIIPIDSHFEDGSERQVSWYHKEDDPAWLDNGVKLYKPYYETVETFAIPASVTSYVFTFTKITNAENIYYVGGNWKYNETTLFPYPFIDPGALAGGVAISSITPTGFSYTAPYARTGSIIVRMRYTKTTDIARSKEDILRSIL